MQQEGYVVKLFIAFSFLNMKKKLISIDDKIDRKHIQKYSVKLSDILAIAPKYAESTLFGQFLLFYLVFILIFKSWCVCVWWKSHRDSNIIRLHLPKYIRV